MKTLFERNLIIIAFVLISILLGANIFFTYRNSKTIEKNMALQLNSEKVKTIISYIAIDIIHNVDLGIRSYALFHDQKYLYPYHKALERKDSIIQLAVTLLTEQNYNLTELNSLTDSIDSYISLNQRLKHLVANGRDEEFIRLADQDKGYQLWLQYERLADNVNAFEDQLLLHAKENYRTALRNNYFLQAILFLICIPTLLFTTIHTLKTFNLERKLRESESERADILKLQKVKLEEIVEERTRDIQKQNQLLQINSEEIAAQNEEIRSQNDQLMDQQSEILAQQDLILAQKQEIKRKNECLEIEVERKTKELVSNNQQLEQFAFITAHNLRAPVARILGLGNILDYAPHSHDEEKLIVKNIVKSAVDLDVVVKDLSTILEIKTNINTHLKRIDFSKEVEFIKANLAREIWETSCQIHEHFEEAPSVYSVKSYIDSILFNLISNSLKYRSTERSPEIHIRSSRKNQYVCLQITDNGIGIDLEKHGEEIFSFYKRFDEHTEGKGLGLHLVKMQVLAMGGYVDVESTPGNGATFSIYLKMHENPEPSETFKAGKKTQD